VPSLAAPRIRINSVSGELIAGGKLAQETPSRQQF
jgi:hypothetical protein